MKRVTTCAGWLRSGLALLMLVVVLGLTACGALPGRSARPITYDFGPGLTAPESPQAARPLLALAELHTSGGVLDTPVVLYRLGYADAQQLRPYALARWSMPPAQLVQQRLRERLSEQRTVLLAGEGAAMSTLATMGGLPGQRAPLLRLELEEFSHFFSSPSASVGLLRLRATLLESSAAGSTVLGQRLIVARQPATTPDAAGGVRALGAATDVAAAEIVNWLAQIEAGRSR
jgi:cholesterol transport system auxiliary component